MDNYRSYVFGLGGHVKFVKAKEDAWLECSYCGAKLKKIRHCSRLSCKLVVAKNNLLSKILSPIIIEKAPIAGLAWNYLLYINCKPWIYIWGRTPWQQFKKMPWAFKPIIAFSPYGNKS